MGKETTLCANNATQEQITDAKKRSGIKFLAVKVNVESSENMNLMSNYV